MSGEITDGWFWLVSRRCGWWHVIKAIETLASFSFDTIVWVMLVSFCQPCCGSSNSITTQLTQNGTRCTSPYQQKSRAKKIWANENPWFGIERRNYTHKFAERKHCWTLSCWECTVADHQTRTNSVDKRDVLNILVIFPACKQLSPRSISSRPETKPRKKS